MLLYSWVGLVRLCTLGRVYTVYTSILPAWHCLHGWALTGGGFGVVRRRSTPPHDIVQCPKEEARMMSGYNTLQSLLYIYLDVRIIIYYISPSCFVRVGTWYTVHDDDEDDDDIARRVSWKEYSKNSGRRGEKMIYSDVYTVVFTRYGHVLYSGPPVGPRIVSRLEVFVCYESLTPAGA